MTRCTKLLAGILLLMLAYAVPASAQTGWGVQRYEGFRADTTGNGKLNLSWSTGNLGNTYNEGEWVPYLLELKNVNINNTNFTPITICYDFTAGNLDARFVDLVKGIQIGTTGLGNSQGWPSDTLGTAFPMTTRAELEIAQNSQGLTQWGNEYLWANYVKIDVDTSQMNLDVNGLPGAPDASMRCFTITRQDIIAAYAPNPVPNSTTFYIYFNLHLSQTFIWENSLQSQLNVDPTDHWGGYLYGNYSAFAGDSRKGSGFVSGSSGQTYLTSGNKTVPIPVPPQPAGALSGMKYHDINGNQTQDGGEGPLDGWPIYIGTIIGGIPISDTLYTDNSGGWSATGLPQALYLVSEELANAPTTGTNSGYSNAAPAFAQTPPSEWVQTYPDNTSTGTDIIGVNTPPPAVLNGYGPYSWEVNSLNNPTITSIDFGNHIPAPVCAVFPSDTTICDEAQATLTAQRIAQGTPPYTYAWTGPNNYTANTQSIVVPASAAGTYTVVLTDANGLSSSGCSGTVNVFPVPDFEITGDTIVCELSTGNAYMPQFDVNSPVPKDSIVAWQWSITGNGVITSSTTTENISVSATTAGSFTLTLTVTDVYGCTETVTRTITVKANPVCSITPVGDVCPGSLNNIFNAPAGAFTYAWSISGNGTINGATSGQSVSVDAGANVGTFTLTLTITETTFPFCTSTCSLTVNVRDIEPPVITCVSDTTVECPAPNPLPFTMPTAVDNCDLNPLITVHGTVTTQGNCPNEYSVTRTWIATDSYSNADTCSQTIFVVDTTPPVVTAASDQTVECDGNGNTAQLNAWLASHGGATASDACGGVTWSNNFTALSDDCGETGSATVTFYATDDCGNVDSTSATFTIEDTTPPVVTAASDLTVECDGNGNIAQLNAWLTSNGGATANDACGGVTWSNNFNGLSDDCGATGSATVTFYATDDCNNVDSTTATFTIEDTTPPDITAGTINGCYDTEAEAEAAAIAATTSSDICGGVTLTASTVGDCNAVITVFATDDCGNADSVAYNTTIDGTPPVFTYVPADTTIPCTSTPVFGTPTATDNCGIPTINQIGNDVTTPGNCPQEYAVTRTWQAVDGCGNLSVLVSQTITVVDDVPPTITAAPDDTVACGQPIIFTDPTYSDNCDPNPTLLIVSDTTIYILGRYEHTREWKAVDACGNESVTVAQTIVELCNEFRSLTQGFYGNPGGSYCGSLNLSTTALIDSLLTAHGPLVVGDPLGSGSLTINPGKGSCVVQYLPGGGPAASLAKHFSFNPNNCNIHPGGMPLKNGRFNNILLSQTITLGLNLRLDTLLAQSFFLPPPSTPWMRTEGADYVNGICGDLDDMPDSTFQNFYFPPSVLTYLGSNGSNVTAQDLLDLANQALGGLTLTNVTLAEITAAVDAINKGFDEARFLAGFYAVPPPKVARPDFRPDGFALHQNHPNPFNPVTTITYSLPEPSTVYLAVYNALGEEISVLIDADASAGTHSVVWDSQSARGTGSSGLFYYRIYAKGESGAVFHDQRKMMLVK